MPARESDNVFRQGRLIGWLHWCSQALDDCISWVKLQALRLTWCVDSLARQNLFGVDRFEPIALLYPRVISFKGFYDGSSLGMYHLPMNGALQGIYDLRRCDGATVRPCNVIGSHRSSNTYGVATKGARGYITPPITCLRSHINLMCKYNSRLDTRPAACR